MRAMAKGQRLPSLRRVLPLAVLGLGIALAPGAAQAQFWNGWGGGGGGEWGGLDGTDIRASIASQGFRVVAPLRRRGAVFVADVVDRRGQRERLVVAAADGQILQRYLLDDPRLPGYVPRAARAMPRDPDEAPVDRADRGNPVPPADIPENGTRRYGEPESGVRRYGEPENGARRYSEPSYGQKEPEAGSQAYGGGDNDLFEPSVRPRPPLKVVKPTKPRVVERTPDTVLPDKPITRKPLDPPAMAPAPLAPAPQQAAPATPKPSGAPPAVASAPNPAPTAPVTTAPAAAPAPAANAHRNPLAIPGGDGKSAQPAGTTAARVIPGVTGAPAVRPAAPRVAEPKVVEPKVVEPKTGDVPVAPLD